MGKIFCMNSANNFFDTLSFELSFCQNLDLVLTTFWRVFAPRMDRLACFQVKRPLKRDLGAEVIDSVLCFHN